MPEAGGRRLSRQGRLGPEGGAERRADGQVFERPDDPRVRGADMEPRTGRNPVKALAKAAIALAAAWPFAAPAADFSPAIIYDFGGKFDRSFNQSASEGAERFKKETGIAVRDFEIQNASQREQVMRQFARRGAGVI